MEEVHREGLTLQFILKPVDHIAEFKQFEGSQDVGG
jgi:hypothetical protein